MQSWWIIRENKYKEKRNHENKFSINSLILIICNNPKCLLIPKTISWLSSCKLKKKLKISNRQLHRIYSHSERRRIWLFQFPNLADIPCSYACHTTQKNWPMKCPYSLKQPATADCSEIRVRGWINKRARYSGGMRRFSGQPSNYYTSQK